MSILIEARCQYIKDSRDPLTKFYGRPALTFVLVPSAFFSGMIKCVETVTSAAAQMNRLYRENIKRVKYITE